MHTKVHVESKLHWYQNYRSKNGWWMSNQSVFSNISDLSRINHPNFKKKIFATVNASSWMLLMTWVCHHDISLTCWQQSSGYLSQVFLLQSLPHRRCQWCWCCHMFLPGLSGLEQFAFFVLHKAHVFVGYLQHFWDADAQYDQSWGRRTSTCI